MTMQHPSELTQLATSLGGLPILGCLPGSPAARAGVHYGDIVLSLDGMPTPSWSAFLQASAQRDGTQPALRLRIFRSGRELDLLLSLSREASSPRAVLEGPTARAVCAEFS
jgi:S1-C subfamily serine protease